MGRFSPNRVPHNLAIGHVPATRSNGTVSHRAALCLTCALAASLATVSPARAGETACWFENGAVVVPAEIGGVAGDWLLDPSAPRTLLHNTRAEMEGMPETFDAPGHLAGQVLAPVTVTVVDLDDRAPGFVTPITGVIGADLLGRYVVDLDFAPCRLRLYARKAPSRVAGRRWTVRMVDGVPAVAAAVSDDRRARAGLFAIDWSSRAAVRLSGASLSPPPAGSVPAPRNAAPGRLRALSVGGALYEEQTAAPAEGLTPALAGTLGTDFWSHWRLRLDIGAGRLTLIPK
jgi:hypothetical protein